MDELLQKLAAALTGHYSVEKLAGQGGMATVFRATDLKHHRPVAIKVLRPELAATVGSDRFLREIELSARLQHPHIVPLYDSGEASGILYYVMPFVEGESLRDRLGRDGTIPFEEAVTLTREVASALSYAHAQGIVHRDIKPENIMLSGGHAVVADFGIARALRVAAESAQNMTGLGIAIGTPAYMSPEQATASEVDGRSDQYSLACVFYEMVSGQAPFTGPTMQAVLTQSLTGPRPRLSKVNRATPPEADIPVQRAMASDPAKRFATVLEFGSALEHAAGGGTGAIAERRRLKRLAVGLPLLVALVAAGWVLFGPRRPSPVIKGAESIAVLPFSVSGPGVELMGEGMVDLLSTNLNAVGGIRAVDPRTVLARWKKTGATGGADLQTALNVAASVKATAALMGSIVATGSRVRISADLYAADGKSLAHAQVDGAADSVLPLVDSLSLSLVRDIWRSREPVPSVRVAGLTTGSLAAMREYLIGEQHYRRAEWDSAAAAFGRAVERDSTFALAHYRLAMALGWKGGYALPQARQASEAALRFAGRLPPRERALVAAYQLFSLGRVAARDSMLKYVAAWPDDVEGWNLLGETQYHSRHINGLGPAALTQPFDRVLALDSTLTPATIHPLETTLAARDSVGYARYLGVMERWSVPEEARAYRAAGELVWRDRAPDSTDGRLLQRHLGALMATFAAAQSDPNGSGDKVLERFDVVVSSILQGNPPDAIKLQMAAGRGLVLASLGRFAAAQKLADSLSPSSMEQSGGVQLLPMMLGYSPPDYGKRIRDGLSSGPLNNPFMAYMRSVLLLNAGDAVRAGKILDSTVRDSTKMPPFLKGAYQGGRGWRTILAGDTTAGLRELREGIERVGGGNTFFGGPLRLQLAQTLLARPETRDEGLRLLKNGFESDLGLLPVTYLALGRAAETAGRKEEALAAYSQFARLWDQADSSAQGRVKEAKDAIARLAGEPKQN